jgi:hypothetical protein
LFFSKLRKSCRPPKLVAATPLAAIIAHVHAGVRESASRKYPLDGDNIASDKHPLIIEYPSTRGMARDKLS